MLDEREDTRCSVVSRVIMEEGHTLTTRECMDTASHDTTDEEEDLTSSRVCASEGEV